MASQTDLMENRLLRLFFLNEAFADVGDAGGLQPSAAAGVFHLSLHTADPGEAGNQTTNETTYTSYARVSVTRDGTGFTVTGSIATNAAVVPFPVPTGGTGTITHVGLGSASSGAGNLFLKAALNTPRAITVGVQMEYLSATLNWEAL